MNRRRSRRRRIRLSVRVEPGGRNLHTADVSTGGVFLRASRVLPVGTPVRMVLQTPDGDFPVQGVVRWAKRVPPSLLPYLRGGLGIEFLAVSPELEAWLRENVARTGSADPGQTPEEAVTRADGG